MKRNFLFALIFIMVLAFSFFTGCKRKINPRLTDQFVNASYLGDIKTVKKLYKEGADINAESKASYNKTALMSASNAGRLEVVKFLISNGANVNYKNSKRYDALGSALTGGKINVVKFLIKSDADINGKGAYGRTPYERVKIWADQYPDNAKWSELLTILKDAGEK